MATWDALLDAYELTVVGVERALAAGDELPSLSPYTPPPAPAAPPTALQLARFESLQERSRVCGERLRSDMERTAGDIGTTRRTGAAARAYGQAGHLADI